MFKSPYAICKTQGSKAHCRRVFRIKRKKMKEESKKGKERNREKHVRTGEYEWHTVTVENSFVGSVAIVRNSAVSRLFRNVRARASVKREPFIHSIYAVSVALFLSRPYFN